MIDDKKFTELERAEIVAVFMYALQNLDNIRMRHEHPQIVEYYENELKRVGRLLTKILADVDRE